ncbi:MAG: hypothetical protein N3F09_08155 [Bacteroidia bacterium]|nr:hypothetical protein [Bacteroidia bacterium]
MKKFFLALAITITFILSAQEQDKKDLNCYNKWAIKFEERGAEEVPDGTYTDVIITSRIGNNAVCNSGKAVVLKGKIVKFYILLSDGNYEEVKRTWKNKSNENIRIINGISSSAITVHNEVINVIFPSKLKPKKAKPVSAPEPPED